MRQGEERGAVRCARCGRVQEAGGSRCRTCDAELVQAQPELALLMEVQARAGRQPPVELVRSLPVQVPPPAPDPLAVRRQRRWFAHAWVGAGVVTGGALLTGLPDSLTPEGLVRGLSWGAFLGAPLGYALSRSSTR